MEVCAALYIPHNEYLRTTCWTAWQETLNFDFDRFKRNFSSPQCIVQRFYRLSNKIVFDFFCSIVMEWGLRNFFDIKYLYKCVTSFPLIFEGHSERLGMISNKNFSSTPLVKGWSFISNLTEAMWLLVSFVRCKNTLSILLLINYIFCEPF